MKKISLILGILVVYLLLIAASSKDGNIIIKNNKKGNIPFPHVLHQEVLVDCNICHSMFEQKPDAISLSITQGKLKKKQVMKHCRACHKSMRNEDKKTGPTKCSACHQK
jgi:hypothetical protein